VASEKQALQFAVALGCVVPIASGAAGVLRGPALLGTSGPGADLTSHFAYLSGLLLAIGIGFASTVPGIERQGRRFRLLTAIVVLGGLGRFYAVTTAGWPAAPMAAALAMELLVTPALAVWQARVARRFG